MVKSNIIKKKASNQDIFQKVKKQLDEAQKMTSEMGELMAEARNILIAYSRCKTESGYENFTDMILESSKKGERLTEKLRRLSLEVVLDQVKYEQYQSELVAVHGIEMDYSDEILKIIMPVLIPHRKEHYTDYLYKPLYIAFKQWCICQNQEQKGYRNMRNVLFALYICITGIYRWDAFGITIILKKNTYWM